MKTIVGITEDLTFNQLSKLDSFVMLYNKISHQLYVDLFPIKELCPAYQAKYLISKRHFDSIRKLLEGKVSSILSLNKNYIIDTKDKIKIIKKDLSTQIKTFSSYKEKYKLNNNNLSVIETNLKKNLSINSNFRYNVKFELDVSGVGVSIGTVHSKTVMEVKNGGSMEFNTVKSISININ